MAFPGTSLDLLVEAYLGQWVDLSDRLTSVPVSIPQRGAPTGSRSAAAGTCVVTLDDDDGALTPLAPTGQYYPYVRRGAPFRVSVRRLNDLFARTETSGWGAGWSAIGAGGTIGSGDSSVSGGQGIHSVPAANAFRATYNTDVSLSDVEVRCVVEMPDATITGGAVEPANLMLRVEDISTYYLVRVSVDTSEAVTVALHHTVAGELAAAVPTGITYSGQQLAVAGIMVGPWFAAKVWNAADPEPRDWQVEVVDHTYAGRGYIGVRSGVASGNSDTKPFLFEYGSVEVRSPRAYGGAASYRPVIVPRTDRTMVAAQRIEVGGLLRQLERGRSGPRSAATRYLPGTNPVVWWPLEDGRDSTQAASGLSGGTPMAVATGIMNFADDAPPGASGSAHPRPDAVNQLRVQGITGVSANAWQIAVWAKADVANADNSDSSALAYYVPWEIVTSTGKYLRLILQWDQNPVLGVAIYNNVADESPTHSVELDQGAGVPYNATIDSGWHLVQFAVEQSGANCNVYLNLDDVEVASAVWASVTVGAPADMIAISSFTAAETIISENIADIYLSQLTIHNGVSKVGQYQAGLGFPGEPAAERIERVCAEDGVSVHVTPGQIDSAAMGPQPVGTLLDLLRECEAVDVGILGESRGAMALTYLARGARYNLPVSMTVDLSTYDTTKGTSGSVLSPVYDDQGLRNEVTAARAGGTSVTVVDQASIDADGRYDDSVTVNVAYDEQLPHIAGWMIAEGVVDEYRNPGFAVDLGANPDLIDAWLSTDAGHRVQRTNPPEPHPPGVIDQIVTGYSEALAPRSWTAAANCLPAAPWTVGIVEDEVLGRADTDGSQWVSAIDAGTDTSGLVLVTAGPPWINSDDQSAMFPFEIKSAGVVLSVTAIEPAARDLFGRSVAAGSWGDATTGQTWSINSGVASNWSVTGTVGLITTNTVNQLELATIDVGTPDADPRFAFEVPVAPSGSGISGWVIARYTDTSNYYYATILVTSASTVELRLLKRAGGTGTQLGSTVLLNGSHTAGDRYVVQVSAIGSTIRARGWRVGQPEERGWHITETDTALTSGTRVGVGVRRESGNTNGATGIEVNDFWVPSLQTLTFDATPVNGVSKTVPAGTALSLAHPWRAAL